jgi:hypothetical protein
MLAVASCGPVTTTHLGSTPSSIPTVTPSPIPHGLVECQAYARAGLLVLHDTTSVVLGEVSVAQYNRESGPALREAKGACAPFLTGSAPPDARLSACSDVGTYSSDAGHQVMVALTAPTNAKAEKANALEESDTKKAAQAWPVCFPGASLPTDLQF